MTKLFQNIQRLLSERKISVLIVLLVLLARIIQLIFFYNIRVDGMYQVMAMQNFVDGHGISLSKVLSSDLSEIIYNPLTNWPPGYSILLSPFYILFNHNYILAGLTLDILSSVTLIFICRRILKVLDIPLYFINIFTLLTGFFIYYFYFIASSDAIAITFFMIAIYFALLVLKKDHPHAYLSVLIIISLFLAGFIKYLFIPIAFIIPVFLFFKGYGEQKSSLKKSGIISFLGLVSLFGILLVYQKITGGSATYISEPTRGWFPENLYSAWPAWPASLIKPETAGFLINGSDKTLYRIFQFTHLLLFVGACIFMIHRIFKYGLNRLSLISSFFYMGFFLSAGITFLLTILSFRVAKEEILPGQWWTYIEEPRYYGLVNVILHIGVFASYHYQGLFRSKALKYLLVGMLVLMLPESFRGIIFTANRIKNFGKEEYSWQNDYKIQEYADSLIKKSNKVQPVDNVVVTGSWYYAYYRIGIYSHVPALIESAKINNLSSLNARKPTLLIIILRDKDFQDYLPFLSSKEKELAGYFRGLYFYTTHVNPH